MNPCGPSLFSNWIGRVKESAKPKIISRDEWLTAQKEMRAREKDHTRAGDALAAARRRREGRPIAQWTRTASTVQSNVGCCSHSVEPDAQHCQAVNKSATSNENQ